MTAEKPEGIESVESKTEVTSGAVNLVPKVEDNVSKILDDTLETSEDQKMIDILNTLD